jgi:large subunit ribosomal protein L17e
MLSTEAGFEYLLEAGYLESELAKWQAEGHVEYMLKLEESLEVMASKGKIWRPEDKPALDVPPHFYGDLAKTVLGSELLAVSGHMRHFAAVLRNKTGSTPALNQRAALWVLVRRRHAYLLTFGFSLPPPH